MPKYILLYISSFLSEKKKNIKKVFKLTLKNTICANVFSTNDLALLALFKFILSHFMVISTFQIFWNKGGINVLFSNIVTV